VILTGDLNDTVQAATTQLLLGPPGSEIGTAGFNRPDHGDAQRLWNLAPLMPEGWDYSRINHGRKELIDHILVSAGAVKPLESVSARAVIDQPLPSVTEDPDARKNDPSSDHAPVVASFAHLLGRSRLECGICSLRISPAATTRVANLRSHALDRFPPVCAQLRPSSLHEVLTLRRKRVEQDPLLEEPAAVAARWRDERVLPPLDTPGLNQ
jgi:hypothetical protein